MREISTTDDALTVADHVLGTAPQQKSTYWWGKMKEFYEDGPPRLIWIGPMTKDEMMEHFDEFRHNRASDLPLAAAADAP